MNVQFFSVAVKNCCFSHYSDWLIVLFTLFTMIHDSYIKYNKVTDYLVEPTYYDKPLVPLILTGCRKTQVNFRGYIGAANYSHKWQLIVKHCTPTRQNLPHTISCSGNRLVVRSHWATSFAINFAIEFATKMKWVWCQFLWLNICDYVTCNDRRKLVL